MEKVGNAIREYFKTENLTQQQVADKFGVTQPFIGRVLRGQYSFGKNVAKQWADEFGFSYTFLLTGEGELFDNDESAIMSAVASDLSAGVDPESAEYWKQKYEESEKENQRLRGKIEGLQYALASAHGIIEEPKKAI